MDILGLILYIVVAAVCAWIADYFVPGTIPGGFLAAAVYGILGAWLGTSLMGSFGPSLGGVALLPAIIGSALVIFLATLIGRAMHKAV